MSCFEHDVKDLSNDESSEHLSMDASHAQALDTYHRAKGELGNRSDALLLSDEIVRTAPKETLSETPNTISGELALSLIEQDNSRASIRRSDSIDRRINETVQFFAAVGESPPSSQNPLQHIIEDDNYDSDEDEQKSTVIQHDDENDVTELPRRPQWPFRRKSSLDPFLHTLRGEVRRQDFVYHGIPKNPPDVTQLGISSGNYAQLHRKAWLEVSDKHHRYGKNLRLYYRHWESIGYPDKNFFDWLDSENGAEGQPLPELDDCPRAQLDSDTVLYISDFEETRGFALSVECDEVGKGVILDVDGNRVRTGSEGWIFVLRDQILYGAQKITSVSGQAKKRFHHSSFFGGKAVSAAGIIITSDEGVLTHVFPHSGHYRPGDADMQRMLFYLHSKDVDLRTFDVDTQQLIHINREDLNNEKRKKTESLHLQPAVQVAHYLSHKARLIGRDGKGVFSSLHKLQTLDIGGTGSVRRALDFIDDSRWTGDGIQN